MLESPKAFFLSRRAPTATFHDSKHSIIHMQYEPTRGWLLTSGTDKIIKVSNCSHSNVSVLFDKEIKLVLISVVCLHPAMGHDSSGIMRILCIVCKQELGISAEPELRTMCLWRTFRVQVTFHGQLHLTEDKLKDIVTLN